jgi:hypothetical protein
MSKKQKTACYAGIMFKLDRIEDQVNKMQKGITKLKQKFSEELDPDEEYCLDELQANQALLESIEELCLTTLLEREPEGDA